MRRAGRGPAGPGHDARARRGAAAGGARKDDAPPASEPWTRADAAALAVLAALWGLAWWRVTGGAPALPYDALRDLAFAENLKAGRWWSDPSLPGLPSWYAPGQPALLALLSRVSGAETLAVASASGLWLNGLAPLVFYALARRWAGRAAAALGAGCAWLGSMWWLAHFHAAMPSIQAVALVLAGGLAWTRAAAGSAAWCLGAGACLGATGWTHPLSALVLGGGIALHAALALAGGAPAAARALAARAALAGGTGALLAAPLALHLLRLPRLNLAPFEWFAPELDDARYVLQTHAPLVPALGLLGAWRLLRGPAAFRWPVGYALAGLAGTLLGYARHVLGWPVPALITHEFLWHFQMALALCAAAGLAGLARRARAGAPRAAALAGLGALALLPALREAGAAGVGAMRLDDRWRATLAQAAWIRAHARLDETFAAPAEMSYALAGLTGRKVVLLPDGHANPASDQPARRRAVAALFAAQSDSAFAAAARALRPDWAVLSPPPGQAARTIEALAAWPTLEPALLSDSSALLYRVRLDRAPAPARAAGAAGGRPLDARAGRR